MRCNGGEIVANIDVALYDSLVSGHKTDNDVVNKMILEVFRWVDCGDIPLKDRAADYMTSAIAAISRIHEKSLCNVRLSRFCLIRLVKRDLDNYAEKIDKVIEDISQNHCDDIDKRQKLNLVKAHLRNTFMVDKMRLINDITDAIIMN